MLNAMKISYFCSMYLDAAENIMAATTLVSVLSWGCMGLLNLMKSLHIHGVHSYVILFLPQSPNFELLHACTYAQLSLRSTM